MVAKVRKVRIAVFRSGRGEQTPMRLVSISQLN
jgi:hypothetical protein